MWADYPLIGAASYIGEFGFDVTAQVVISRLVPAPPLTRIARTSRAEGNETRIEDEL